MNKTVAAYLAFDNIYLSEQQATNALDGWEHKEVVTPVFISVSYHDLETLRNQTVLEQVEYMASVGPSLYDTFEQAEEETAEENEDLYKFYVTVQLEAWHPPFIDTQVPTSKVARELAETLASMYKTCHVFIECVNDKKLFLNESGFSRTGQDWTSKYKGGEQT